MSEAHKIFQEEKNLLLNIDPNRGGGPEKLKGFYMEILYATDDNLERAEKGIKAKVVVTDTNGDADAVIRYTDGRLGREIQYKGGYSYSKHKGFLSSGKYDGMIYVIDKDNPVFSDPEKLAELEEIASRHNIKLVRGSISSSEVETVAVIAFYESKAKKVIGVDDSPVLTVTVYSTSREAVYAYRQLMKKRAEFNNYIATQSSVFLSGSFAEINRAGVSQALGAAEFAAAYSVARNTISIIKGEEELGDAAKAVLIDTSTAAAVGYATGALSQIAGIADTNDAAVLVNGAIQISKQVFSYMNGEIDESKLIQNVAETTAYLAAAYIGKSIGGAIGSAGGPVGAFVGQYVGEMITTAVCSVVIETIHYEKDSKKYNSRMLSLAHQAEYEIRASQERLTILVKQENAQFIGTLNDGYARFVDGLMNCNYEVASSGLAAVGQGFGIKQEVLQQGHVTKGQIFSKQKRVITLG